MAGDAFGELLGGFTADLDSRVAVFFLSLVGQYGMLSE